MAGFRGATDHKMAIRLNSYLIINLICGLSRPVTQERDSCPQGVKLELK
jgi:hypothetical protein